MSRLPLVPESNPCALERTDGMLCLCLCLCGCGCGWHCERCTDALLARLRALVVEIRESGALDVLPADRFSQAIEDRADDGSALVEYVRSKVHEAPTDSYHALIKARRPDLTVEALASEGNSPWASEFTDGDRSAAGARLGPMLAPYRAQRRPMADLVGPAIGVIKAPVRLLWERSDIVLAVVVAILMDCFVVYRFVATQPPISLLSCNPHCRSKGCRLPRRIDRRPTPWFRLSSSALLSRPHTSSSPSPAAVGFLRF